MRRAWTTWVAVLALGLIAVIARAQPEPPASQSPPTAAIELAEDSAPLGSAPAPTTGTLALLRALESRHGSVRTIHGVFSQLKQSEIFLEEIVSSGEFWFQKPDLFRSDYNPPDEMTNLILKDAIYLHMPSIQQVEVYHFTSPEERDQQLHAMVIGFGFDTEELIREYEVHSSADEAALIQEIEAAGLDPKKTSLLRIVPVGAYLDTSPFTRLKLWLDSESLLPEKIWYEDYNGDKMTLTIEKLELGVKIDPELFLPKFPPGTEVIDKTDF